MNDFDGVAKKSKFEQGFYANEVIDVDDDDDDEAQSTENTTNIVEIKQNPTLSILNDDCWRSVFDWLPSADVKSMGQTCKKMHIISAAHIKLKYPAKKLLIRTPPIHPLRPSQRNPNGFHKYYRNVILQDFDMGIFRFLATNIPLPIKIQFFQKSLCKRINDVMVDCIRAPLSVVESIEILGCKIDGDLYEKVLQFCENMKRLSIRIYTNEGFYIGPNDDWLERKYPKLQHLALVKGPRHIEQLKTFFEENGNVTSFTTSMSIVNLNQTELQHSAVNLDDLGIELSLDDKIKLPIFTDFLNKIRLMGRFKRLKLRLIDPSILTGHVDDITSMAGLHSIYFDCEVKINKQFIAALAKVSMDVLYIRRSVGKCDEAEPLINGAPNIKELYFQQIDSEEVNTHVLPFIQRAPNVKKISIRKINGRFDLALAKINKERDKNNEKLYVFLDDATFIHIKWQNKDIHFKGIEVKRIDSDVKNHPFALHDE